MLSILLSLAQATPLELWIDLSETSNKRRIETQSVGFLEQQDGSWMLFEADDSLLVFLLENDIPYRIHQANERSRPMGYASAEDMLEQMASLAQMYPDVVELHRLGSSVQGRPISGMRLSRTDEPILTYRVLGAHHGDELSSAEVTYAFAEHILENSTDPVLSDWLDLHALWIVPHVNPDGIEALTRRNANSVDLNRNYGYQWSSSEWASGQYAFSEPETNAIRLLEEWNSFTAGLSLHSGTANLSWVWNYDTFPTADDSLVQEIAEQYADECEQPDFWLINGGEWYITYGDTTDWSYGVHGTFDFTLEVSFDKSPSPSELPEVISYHIPPMQTFLQWPHWISAQTVNEQTGALVQSSWTLLEDGWTTASGPTGKLSRLVENDGPWTVEISAPGFQTQTVTLTSGSHTPIPLTPDPSPLNLSCAIQQTGDLSVELPSEIQQASLYRGQEWITNLQQGESWTASGTDLLAGVYHLYTNIGDYSNWLVLFDQRQEVSLSETEETIVVAGESLPGERFWQLLDGQLRPLTITNVQESQREVEVAPSNRECIFSVSGGMLTHLQLPEEEPEPDQEPAEEPDDEFDEPSSEPAAEVDEEPTVPIDSTEDETLKAGCHMTPQKHPFWLAFLMSILVLRRANVNHHHTARRS